MGSNFEPRADDLKTAAQKASEKMLETESNPKWFPLRGSSPTDLVDAFDHGINTTAFQRDADAKEYADAVTTPKSIKLAQAAKLQSDYLAALERDSRMRHRTRIRMMAHGIAKLATHGLEDGPIKRGVLFVNRLKEQADG